MIYSVKCCLCCRLLPCCFWHSALPCVPAVAYVAFVDHPAVFSVSAVAYGQAVNVFTVVPVNTFVGIPAVDDVLYILLFASLLLLVSLL